MKYITWISLILGLWLIALPYALGFESSSTIATGTNVVVGILFIVCSAWTLTTSSALIGVNAFQALCSIWLIVAPFATRYSSLSQATLNDVIVGIIVLAVSLTEMWWLGRSPVRG